VERSRPLVFHPARVPPGAHTAGLLLGPAALAAAYLWNPFGLLSTVAGTTTPLENAAVAAALLGGAARNAPLAAAGLAAGAYLGLHPVLLAVRRARAPGRARRRRPRAASASGAPLAAPTAAVSFWQVDPPRKACSAHPAKTLACQAGLPSPPPHEHTRPTNPLHATPRSHWP
jgi:hypothetical protein